jgi:glycine C-acetyltransferase
LDLFNKLSNRGPLGQHQKMAHGYFTFPSNRMVFRGKEHLVWSLNNYLGLANHPEVRKADAEGAAQYGLALPMGARMMSGNSNQHEQLERNLAEFVKREDAFLLNYGYQGMVSIIDTLVNRHDVIVYDAESHACIIDGVRLHQGKRYVYNHNDMASLEGVFGMSGAQGNLKGVVELKKKFDFRLLVDDAHGFGTMGPTGAGTDEEQGVQEGVDVYFGTFAKSMAGIGAFVASTEDVVNFLRYNMRSQTFAKTIPMPMVIGLLKRLELLRTNPELKNNLWKIVHALQTGLRERGFDIGKTSSPVTPVFLTGTLTEATNIVMDLRENYSIFCSIVTYPVVPKGVIMLRLIPSAIHTLADVEETLKAYSEVGEKLKEGFYENNSPLEMKA